MVQHVFKAQTKKKERKKELIGSSSSPFRKRNVGQSQNPIKRSLLPPLAMPQTSSFFGD